MKDKLAWIVLCGALAVLCFYGAAKLTTNHIAHAQVSVTPFVLRTESYNYDKGPKGELFVKEVVARRSDGATAVISTVGDLSLGYTIKTLTFLDGTSITVYDPIRTKSSWHVTTQRLAQLKEHLLLHPAPDCMPEGVREGPVRILGDDLILGHKVIQVESKFGSGRLIEWDAPDLACKTLEFRFEERQPDGSLKIKTHEKAISLDIGEPPSSIFDVGADYQEMKPSEAQARYFQKAGVPEDTASKQSAQQADIVYLRGQR
jgi:hypothetical protein